jgi:uncharacterized protein (UPF0248 family)
MRSSLDVYSRILYSGEYDDDWMNIVVGYIDRFLGLQELPFVEFRLCKDQQQETFIPWHRVIYFRLVANLSNDDDNDNDDNDNDNDDDHNDSELNRGNQIRTDSNHSDKCFLWHRSRRIDNLFHSTSAIDNDNSQSNNTRRKFSTTCQFHIVGKCSKGKRCRYLHDNDVIHDKKKSNNADENSMKIESKSNNDASVNSAEFNVDHDDDDRFDFDSLKVLKAARRAAKRMPGCDHAIFLVLGGSFAPIHNNHVRMLTVAIDRLSRGNESLKDRVIVGGAICCSHDAAIARKFGVVSGHVVGLLVGSHISFVFFCSVLME